MKILVTGGAGFIAGHLIERLLLDGHDIVAVDNVDFSVRHSGNKKLMRKIRDITDPKTMKERYFQGTDWIFHLAGRSDIVPSVKDPASYHQINVTGTLNMLEAARRWKVKRFIYIASSTCYGIPDNYPTSEKVSIRPMYPYALTKYAGELYALHWSKFYKLPVVSLRLFNVYGPRSRASAEYGPVFTTFMAQKLAGVPFTVVGDGTQSRDFTFVTDVVDAMIAVAKSKVSGEVFNVGSGGTYAINYLVKLLGGEAVYIPKRPAEPDCTWADITKIKKILNWKPKITFEEGVKIVLNHISDWKGAPVWTPTSIKKATREWFAYLS